MYPPPGRADGFAGHSSMPAAGGSGVRRPGGCRCACRPRGLRSKTLQGGLPLCVWLDLTYMKLNAHASGGSNASKAENMWRGPLASRPTLQPMNERVMPERTLAVSVPGCELIGGRSGSGRPLLVLHGAPAVNDCSDWFAA